MTTKANAVEALLSSRAQAPSLPRAKFLRNSIDDLNTLPSPRILSAPHPYRYIALDPAFGGLLLVSLDGPVVTTQSQVERFTLHPGSWAPISGRSVFARVMVPNGQLQADYLGRQFDSYYHTRDVICWLTEEPSPPPLRSVWLPSAYEETLVPGTDVPTLEDDGVALEPGCNYVTINIIDNSAGQPIQAAETADIEVWWWDQSSGTWAHNHNDDFDTDGRGAATGPSHATPNHTVEVYHVPNNFGRIYLRRTSGDTLWGALTFSRDNR